jgi:tRNA pseudouridine38-40 synthase
VSNQRNIKLLLAYDGTHYAGWQKQKSEPSIQAAIETKIHVMTGEDVCLHGAGRTDAGVHALGMVANFYTSSGIPCKGFLKGLNSMLPDDIRLLQVTEAAPDFHARRSAKAKTYLYFISCGPVQVPTERLYAAYVYEKLDIQAMEKGLTALLGTHDFSSFEAAGSRDPEIKTGRGAVRTLFEVGIEVQQSGERLQFFCKGDGFLRHMVRNIVGTMLEVGKGKVAPTEIKKILTARDRAAAGPTAPPQGLFLKQVHY